MTGRLDFGFTFGATASAPSALPRDGKPFRMVVLGDFSGHGLRGLPQPKALAQRKPVRVDIDNAEAVFARLAPALALSLPGVAGNSLALSFGTLDDFHPDQLLPRLPAPVVADDAPAAWATTSSTAPPPASAPEDHASTLERLLGRKPDAAPVLAAAADGLDALIKSIVTPSLLPEVPAAQLQSAQALQAAQAGLLRSVLHHPDFQSLEAQWLGVLQLVRNLDLDGDLQLHLLDVSQAELQLDAASNQDAGLAQSLQASRDADEDEDSAAWSLIVGLQTFGPLEADLRLLASLGALAGKLGGSYVASASPAVVGLASVTEQADASQWPGMAPDAQARWEAFRRTDEAARVHLAWPRLLLRLPYGRDTDPVSALPFEEHAPAFAHEHALWGHGSLAAALLIGQSFMDRGWDMRVGDLRDVEDLPAHVLTQDGEKRLLPCAEANLSEGAGERLLALGLMPLLSYKQRNAVRVMSFQAMG